VVDRASLADLLINAPEHFHGLSRTSKLFAALRSHADDCFSRTIIQRVLNHPQGQTTETPGKPEKLKRYSRPVPSDRVQPDSIKIATGVYQYAAVDDCSRFRVLGLYPRRASKHTVAFLERVIQEMLFPIQRVRSEALRKQD